MDFSRDATYKWNYNWVLVCIAMQRMYILIVKLLKIWTNFTWANIFDLKTNERILESIADDDVSIRNFLDVIFSFFQIRKHYHWMANIGIEIH